MIEKRERNRNLSMGSLPKWSHCLGLAWARLKPGIWNSIHVSNVGGRGPECEQSLAVFLGTTAESWIGRLPWTHLNSDMGCWCCRQSLNSCITMLAPLFTINRIKRQPARAGVMLHWEKHSLGCTSHVRMPMIMSTQLPFQIPANILGRQ